ncbi:PepSY domain-containing protein [Mucilaginibacter sp. RS28]|uniref:PepSY domain-containing protein n=1 Tax=Mucilaginibacter straminoryzae TaxID=2932774 RepID=A0A9X2BAE2_9SPHI|nr:PepSY-associated TM helix domain-containing protein [Mucilaginibacter straminoryzae]MCJ8208697.1 PepSY domain-containing protein [Mucilaginibacter straminoryzae]
MIRKRLKAVAAWLHLWIGLVTGVIVVIVSVSGCILVFEDELFDLFHKDLVYVNKTGPARPVSELLKNVKKVTGPKKDITDIRINADDKSYIFTASKVNKHNDINLSYFSQFKYRDEVYVNPYTGKVLGVIDTRYEFFNVTEQLHRQLLLVKPVGSVVIGCCILLFLVMLITGFILWLPKNIRQLKKSLSVKWSAKWKRVNYDLHNSFGFYVLPVAIIIAVTGLTWSFKWWEKGIYKALGSSKPVILVRNAPTISTPDSTGDHLDEIVYQLKSRLNGNYHTIGLNLPKKNSKAIMAFVYIKKPTDGWRNISYYYFDARTGKQFDQLEHASNPLGLKWRNSNKDIHTGRIYGLPTQILAFLASLICASLPITGFLIWWGKRNKKSKKTRGKYAAHLIPDRVEI